MSAFWFLAECFLLISKVKSLPLAQMKTVQPLRCDLPHCLSGFVARVFGSVGLL